MSDPGLQFTYRGANQEEVKNWVVSPTGMVSTKKYPLLIFLHAGPEENYNDGWGQSLNFQVFANKGYYSFLVNFHGTLCKKYTHISKERERERVKSSCMLGGRNYNEILLIYH
tara:strand:+ start:2273 stop:2611 length:339 start_codon:yes stop_codon:yes gene_type:complete